jgi:hypothetical protein
VYQGVRTPLRHAYALSYLCAHAAVGRVVESEGELEGPVESPLVVSVRLAKRRADVRL